MAIPITIFTPTFNRAELLARAYQSLREQTYQGFEWLIVDDGSTDDTADRVHAWQRSAPFAIRYLRQPHGGKNRAHNFAIAHASGDLYTELGSDDALVPQAIERLLFHWSSIPESERHRFSGVTCLSMDQSARLVGRPFPVTPLDCRNYEAEAVFRATGEKWGFHRTAILREFPFPDIPGEIFCPEALIWNRIARHYVVRHVNELLRFAYVTETGITANWTKVMMRNAQGARLYYQEYIDLPVPAWWKAKRAVNYIRFSLHAGVSARGILGASAAKGLTALVTPAAVALYARDCFRFGNVRRTLHAAREGAAV